MRQQHQLQPFESYLESGLQLHTEEDGAVLWIVFNRPDKMNAVNWKLSTALQSICVAFPVLGFGPGPLWVVVFAGNGRNFSAGLDFTGSDKEVTDVPGPQGLTQATIACVHGPLTGLGLATALSCDVRIASPTFRCSIGANRLGLSGGDIGLSYLLRSLCGSSNANVLMMTHRWMDAGKALRTGLVSEVVEESEAEGEEKGVLREAGRVMARDMLQLTRPGLLYTKQLVLMTESNAILQAAIIAEDAVQMATAGEPEAQAYGAAFRGKITKGRPPPKL
ncbi:ClpP/crotonase [Gonapodya prolifera JEL478]|uniref:ClpP/crotonase n=1 Tax=Gonapodya prolifera (strain JEL478) TaxID=1344416 RepID=A0A139ABD1_GONPJ|nr:ClpP/crotonase [Gonapodya prolifera JEL478]|eukprot:KXS13979.1 ClpP/crotonase [Gonapodya prolifera JEL478]